MILELLDTEDFEDLPEDPNARWVVLEKLARARLSAALASDDSGRTEKNLKLQYMHLVSGTAADLGIKGVNLPAGNDPSAGIDVFMIHAQTAASRILLNGSGGPSLTGFKLRNEAKIRIRELLTEIQKLIPDLNLEHGRENRLVEALLGFSTELENPKSRFSVGSAHLVAAMTVLNLAVTTAAAGPDALSSLQQIQTIWGEEKGRSESGILRIPYEEPRSLLTPPLKQIPGPSHEIGEA